MPTEQLEIGFPPVRRNDPPTSHQAARPTIARGQLKARVAAVLAQFPTGLTDWELTAALGMDDRKKPTVAKRRHDCGAVPVPSGVTRWNPDTRQDEDVPVTRLSPDGQPCIVWRLR